MHVHEEVLAAANEIVARPGSNGIFSVSEVVVRLPHLKESTVRTHVSSRCCVNAPKNHLHRWKYFRRVAHGEYEIMPEYRQRRKNVRGVVRPSIKASIANPKQSVRGTIHVIVREERGVYTAECVEIAVVTQGRSLDELLRNLNEAVALHLEGEDFAALGLAPEPTLQLLYEVPIAV